MQHRLQRFVGWLGVACGLSAAIRAKVEHPFRVIKRQSGTLGTKGVGELGTIRATTAVVNAVVRCAGARARRQRPGVARRAGADATHFARCVAGAARLAAGAVCIAAMSASIEAADTGAGTGTDKAKDVDVKPVIDVDHPNRPSPGHLPGHLGIVILSLAPGELRAEMPVTPLSQAPNGFLHAGSVVSLADTTAGYGCLASLPASASGFTTIELKSNHLGTALQGTLDCVATAAHRGKITQVCDAVVTHRETGKTLASFRCTQRLLYGVASSLSAAVWKTEPVAFPSKIEPGRPHERRSCLEEQAQRLACAKRIASTRQEATA